VVYASMKASPKVASGAAFALIALLLVAGPAGPSLAQSGAPPKSAAKSAQASAPTETVIISQMPERKGPIYRLLKKLFCKNDGSVTGAAGTEVWSVPQRQTSRVTKALEALGMKVTKLAEDWNQILKPHTGAMSTAQQEMVDKVKSNPGVVGVGVLRIPDTVLTAFAMTNESYRPTVPTELQTPSKDKSKDKEKAPSTVVLPISPTQNITLQRVKYSYDARGCTWRGIVVETGESALLMRWNDGHITGLVGYKGRIYTVASIGEGLHAMVEMDPRQMPPDHAAAKPTADPRADLRPDAPAKVAAPATLPMVKPLSDAERKALESKKIVIDVMMLYTKKAASRYVRDPADLLAMAVEQANDTFVNSGLANISLRLVHTQAVDYDESEGEHFDHLYRMVDGVGAFKDIRKLRDEKKADIVGLIIDDASGCGLSTRVAPDSEDAYFVVHHSCASITISVAHEIGHILGARHDRAIDTNDAPFAYGHGYVNGKWRDIMSYQQSCNGCVRIPMWSNPRVFYRGEPTGTEFEDNARVILEQAERVSKFR
jgi:peptidyl-Asp metalloendopeptidase